MIATVYAARIDGPSAFLSLHTSYEGAVNAVLREGARLHQDRLGYVPSALRPRAAKYGTTAAAAEYGITAAAVLQQAADRLFGAGGWIATVEELPVELDGPEEAEATCPGGC